MQKNPVLGSDMDPVNVSVLRSYFNQQIFHYHLSNRKYAQFPIISLTHGSEMIGDFFRINIMSQKHLETTHLTRGSNVCIQIKSGSKNLISRKFFFSQDILRTIDLMQVNHSN